MKMVRHDDGSHGVHQTLACCELDYTCMNVSVGKDWPVSKNQSNQYKLPFKLSMLKGILLYIPRITPMYMHHNIILVKCDPMKGMNLNPGKTQEPVPGSVELIVTLTLLPVPEMSR